MRKKDLIILFFCFLTTQIAAQNIQLHYDFGSALYKEQSTRPKLTSTIEFFKADPWGSTFFFVDMDYADGKVASAYWEISRELKFWQNPFSIHLEYNGGLNYINNAYLGGVTYTWNSQDFSRGFGISAMYKYLHHHPKPHTFQLTGNWHIDFAKGKCSFSGFADFWREEHTDAKGNPHDFIFLAEPQFWVNLNKFKGINDKFNLSIGTEWELSHHFYLLDGFHFNPTLAMKWSF